MSIKFKIIGCFVILFVISTLFALRALDNMAQVHEQFSFVVKHDSTVIANANRLLRLVVDMETGQRGFAITQKQEFLEPYNNANKDFYKLLEIEKGLVSDNPDQMIILIKIGNLVKQWHQRAAAPEITKTREIIAAKDIETKHGIEAELASLLESGTGKKLMDEIRYEFAGFIKAEEQLTKQRFETASQTTLRTKKSLLYWIAFSLILGYLIAALIFRLIVNPIQSLTSGTEIIGAGNLKHRVEIRTNDEIGSLSSSFNQMVDKIEHSEAEIQHVKALLESCLESSLDITIFMLDRQYHYLYFNQTHANRMARVYGVRPRVGDISFNFVTSEEDKKKAKAFYDRALAGERFIVIEDFGIKPLKMVYEIHYNPIITRNNKIIGITVFAQDISKRQQTEQQLQRKTLDIAERVKELNCLYGISEIVEKADDSLPEIFNGINTLIQSAWQNPEHTRSCITFDGQEYIAENFQKTIFRQTADINVFGEPRGIIEVCSLEETVKIDDKYFLKEEKALLHAIAERLGRVIERRLAKESLRHSEKKYKDLYDSAADMFVSVDAKTASILDCNNILIKQLGYSKEELIGRSVFDVYTQESAEHAKAEVFPLFLKTGTVTNEELQLQRKDGSRIDVNLNASAVRDEEGKILYSRSAWRDITETKRLQDQLNRSDRLAAVGQLATSIAHEINSPLQGITSILGLMKQTHNQNTELISDITMLDEGYKRVKDTVKRLLDMSRPEKDQKQSVNINDVILDSLSLVRVLMKQNKIEAEINLSSRLALITASPQQLGHVFLNLFNNAIESIVDKGQTKGSADNARIRVETKQRKENIIIEVADTGFGIIKNDINKIFDPFYTKKKTMGIGVGLSICHGIIEDHNGSIVAKNLPRGGALFLIKLPVNQ